MQDFQEMYSRGQSLVGEVMRGELKKDILPASSYAFAEERQALYYSNMRKNMESDMAHAVMSHRQHLHELDVLKEWERNE